MASVRQTLAATATATTKLAKNNQTQQKQLTQNIQTQQNQPPKNQITTNDKDILQYMTHVYKQKLF